MPFNHEEKVGDMVTKTGLVVEDVQKYLTTALTAHRHVGDFTWKFVV